MSDSTAAARSRRLLVLLAALLGLCIAALAFGLWARGRTPDAQREVLRCGDLTLTNQDLAYYYWSEYYFLINEGGSSLDPDTNPAAQPVDDTRTWQDTLLDRALVTAQDTLANVLAAQDTGFALPESYETSLAQVMDDLSSYAAALGFTDDAGAADLTAYLQASYGSAAEPDSFRRYMENAYLATAYADAQREALPQPEESAVRAYFVAHAQDYPELSLTDGPMPNALLLCFDQYDDNSSMAATVLSAWLADNGGESALRELADTYCGGADALTAAYPGDGQTPDCAADWLFSPARQIGDSTVVSDDSGAYLLYITGFQAQTRWQQAASDALLDEQARNESLLLTERYPLEVNRSKIVILQPEGLFDTNEQQK